MKRYFLDQDNDGHWFIVDASKRAEWEAWKALDAEDVVAWTPPTGIAEEVNSGPGVVTFEQPEIHL
jgi:hypothetical protein